MNETLRKVENFHKVFGHRIGKLSDTNEPLQTRQLRIKLLFEELMELAEASNCERTFLLLAINSFFTIGNKYARPEGKISDEDKAQELAEIEKDVDIIRVPDGDNVNYKEELDALCDLQYVLNGKIITAGYQSIFDREFDNVHMNNMTKAHQSEEHALETAKKAALEDGYSIARIEDGLRNVFVLTNKDGKVIKPHDHIKVALSLKE